MAPKDEGRPASEVNALVNAAVERLAAHGPLETERVEKWLGAFAACLTGDCTLCPYGGGGYFNYDHANAWWLAEMILRKRREPAEGRRANA